MKASERRALVAALPAIRCPSCNHLRLGVLTAGPLTLICSCGWSGPATVTFTSQFTRGGHRTVAVVTIPAETGRNP